MTTIPIPTLGRTVLYCVGHKMFTTTPEEYPAVVTHVHDCGSVDLFVMKTDSTSHETRIVEAPNPEEALPGHWRWPPRAPC